MNKTEKSRLFRQIMWDYNISKEDIELLIDGKNSHAGHYTKETFFKKMLETYSWFTILQIYTPIQIRDMLTTDLVNKLRMPSLRNKYEFVQKRLHEIIPFTG